MVCLKILMVPLSAIDAIVSSFFLDYLKAMRVSSNVMCGVGVMEITRKEGMG